MMFFIDFSSAFNIIIPDIAIDKLLNLGLSFLASFYISREYVKLPNMFLLGCWGHSESGLTYCITIWYADCSATCVLHHISGLRSKQSRAARISLYSTCAHYYFTCYDKTRARHSASAGLACRLLLIDLGKEIT